MITAPAAIYSTLNDDEELLELVELFVSELPVRMAKLTDLTKRGDIAELGRFAHQLKGAAGSYGFDEVTPYAAHLEQAARSGGPIESVESAARELLEDLRQAACRNAALNAAVFGQANHGWTSIYTDANLRATR